VEETVEMAAATVPFRSHNGRLFDADNLRRKHGQRDIKVCHAQDGFGSKTWIWRSMEAISRFERGEVCEDLSLLTSYSRI
jgi:hypothetical protein